jgi:hypothetical protein
MDRGRAGDLGRGGLLSEGSATGGLGMWITHQSCNHVVLGRDDDGFTVRLTAGNAGGHP